MKQLFEIPGDVTGFEKVGAKRFKKDILPVGEVFHPFTEETTDFTPQRLEAIVAATNGWIENGNKVSFPTDHWNDTLDNLGFWDSFEIGTRSDGTTTIFGFVEVTAEEHVDKVGTTIQDVSAFIEKHVLDSGENYYPEVITHVCATQIPVIRGQDNFVETFARKGFEVISLSRTKDMDKLLAFARKLAEAIGYDLNGADKDPKMLDGLATRVGELAKTAGESTDRIKKLEGDLELARKEGKKEDTKVPEVTPEMERLLADNRQLMAQGGRDWVEKQLQLGRISPAMKDAAAVLALARTPSMAVALSGDKELTVNVAEAFRKFVEAIPDHSVVPLERTGKKQQSDDKKESAESIAMYNRAVRDNYEFFRSRHPNYEHKLITQEDGRLHHEMIPKN